jgi:hypothetical protein
VMIEISSRRMDAPESSIGSRAELHTSGAFAQRKTPRRSNPVGAFVEQR